MCYNILESGGIMLLIAENIQKTYSDKILLDHITLSVDQKDKIGIIGANGCGKSTLLKIISVNLKVKRVK